MKKIYTISLDDEVPLSDKVIDDIKVICYLVYDDIKIFDDKYGKPVTLVSGVSYNELYEKKTLDGTYAHRFKYNDPVLGNYEPFMIGNNSFAFTVEDGCLDDSDVMAVVEEAKRMLGVDYHFKLDTVTYVDDKKNKNRLLAIKQLCTSEIKAQSNVAFAKRLKPFAAALHALIR